MIVPSKSIIPVDTLSRAPNNWFTEKDSNVFQNAELQVNMVMSKTSETNKRLIEIKETQERDEIYIRVKQQCRED